MEPHSPESWQLLLVGVTRQGFGKFFREMGGEVRGRETKMAYISAAPSSVLALPQSALHSGWWGVTFHSSLLRALPQRPPPLPSGILIRLYLFTLLGRSFYRVSIHIAILSTFLRSRPVRWRKGPEMHLPSYIQYFLRGIRSKRNHIFILF